MIVRDKSNRFQLLFAWHGTILPRVLPALCLVLLISTAVVMTSKFELFKLPEVPMVGFTIFGVILSIFLSFRNSACYERWWEGRKLWGLLIATTRHWVRDTHILKDAALRQQMLYQQLLFNHLLRDRLRQSMAVLSFDLKQSGYVVQEFDKLRMRINAPQCVLEQMQQQLVASHQQGQITDILYRGLNEHLVQVGEIQAGCDRILSTPLPFSYSVLLHRAVYSFVFILPFSLEASLGIATPILVALIAYLFLGFDELSSELEEPFGMQDNDLALDAMVRLMERETLDSLGHDLPTEIRPHSGHLT